MIDYKYYAFISYKREDEKWAKWIQNQLETYRLPAKIRKEHLVPKKISPIFRDKTDLGAGVLSENIKTALRQSKYLIVVCSPRSATSEWVGKEIRDFVAVSGSSRIIPLIVDGIPNTGESDECFNPALKEIQPELLGVNVKEVGRRRAFVKIIAQLLELSFDELWNRDKRRQRRKKIRNYLIILLSLSLLSVVLINFWPKVEYYVDISEYGDGWYPRGIDRLTPEEVRHRNEHYMFIYNGKQLQRVAKCNSASFPVGEVSLYVDPKVFGSPDYYHEIYTYYPNGALECVYSVSGEDLSRVDVKDGESPTSSGMSVVDGIPTDIKRFILTRNVDGLVTRIEYKKYNGEDGVPASNPYGVYGEERVLDTAGRVAVMRFLDKDGNAGYSDINGICEVRNEYDCRGNLLSISNYDDCGQLIVNSEGIAVCRNEYDDNGNVVLSRFYDSKGNSAISIYGFSGCEYEYDEHGYKTRITYLGSNFQPKQMEGGYCSQAQSYNENGWIVKVSYADTTGDICLNKEKFATVEHTYDKYGKTTANKYYGLDGALTITSYNYAEERFLYDSKTGLVSEVSYYDAEGLPCMDDRGISREVKIANEPSDSGRILYYGVDGQPCLNCEAVAGVEYFSGLKGFITKLTYLGTDGMPVCDSNGVQSVLLDYDQECWLYRISNTDASGQLHNDSRGAATYQIIRAQETYKIEVEAYDSEGKPVEAPSFDDLLPKSIFFPKK